MTPIIKITAKEINWSEFIKYIAANNDKNMLDWDNMYAPQKQKHLLIYYINQKRILLEKDKNIILSPNYDNWKELDIRRIQFLNALQELEKDGLIIINGFSLCNPSNLYYYPSIKANITISKKFGEFIKTIESKTEKEYTATSQNQPSIAKKLDKPMQTQNQEKVLYLNNVGELYREPKTKYCYPMNEKSNRYKVIRFLTDNKGYQITKVIAGESGYKSEQTTRTEIGKIRNNIKKYLKIDGKDLLQGKKESGYRINPKYKIVFKDE